MLTVIEAQNIGRNKCIELLGRDNIRARKDTACAAYGTEFSDGKIRYFIGITDSPVATGKINTRNTNYEYRAIVDVYQDGTVDVVECVTP